MSRGEYRLPSDAEFEKSRERILHPTSWFAEPEGVERIPVVLGERHHTVARLLSMLDEHGVVACQPDGQVANRDLIDLAQELGDPIPEIAAVHDHVEDEVVLRLVMDRAATTIADYQPFGENPITLHTEASHWPLADQPRYLLFFCDAASEAKGGGQTILTSMAGLAARLGADAKAVLAQITFDGRTAPAFLRNEQGFPVFCFRDFDTPLTWRAVGPQEVTADAAAEGLDALMRRLYEPEHVYGIRWQTGDLVLFDNRRFLHGRAIVGTGDPQSRRLRRLRIRPHAAGVPATLDPDG